MTTLGSNLKITAPRSAQPQLRTIYNALGAKLFEASPDMDVFMFGAARVGYAYVAEAEALTPAQMRLAPWHELAVDDLDQAIATLDVLGVERVPYHDGRAYFAAPGGSVFRLAARGG